MAASVGTYRASWRLLLPSAAILFAPLALLDALGEELPNVDVERFNAVTAGVLAATVVEALFSEVGDQFYAGVAAAAVAEARGSGPHSLVRLARTLPYVRLILADVILAVGTAVGLGLFLVPGVLFFTWFGLTAPVIKIEGLGLTAAMRRSRRLVRGNFLRVLVLLTVLQFGGNALTNALQDGTLTAIGDSFLGDWAAAYVVGLTVTPAAAVIAVVTTYELIDLHDGRRVRGRRARRREAAGEAAG